MKTPSEPPIEPRVEFPADQELLGVSHLFEGQWVWQGYRNQLDSTSRMPIRLSVEYFSYRPGHRALVTYFAEWWKKSRLERQDFFYVELKVGRPGHFFRYPEDPYLPGLGLVVSDEAKEHFINNLQITP